MFAHRDLIKAALGIVKLCTWRKDNEQRKKIFINIAKRMLVITPYLLVNINGAPRICFYYFTYFFWCNTNDKE